MLHVVCFSKDRVFQLKQYLRSFVSAWGEDRVGEQTKHVEGLQVRLHVLYTFSVPEMETGYRQLLQEFPWVEFIEEASFAIDFTHLIHSMDPNEFVLFNVDDAIYYAESTVFRDVVQTSMRFLQDQSLQVDGHEPFGVHLKLNPTICYSQPQGFKCLHPLPSFRLYDEKGCLLYFVPRHGRLDWNYPWDLSGSMYRVSSVVQLLADITKVYGLVRGMNHPNTLEVHGNKVMNDQRESRKMWMACPNQPLMSVLAINRVQDVYLNPVYPPTEMLMQMQTQTKQPRKPMDLQHVVKNTCSSAGDDDNVDFAQYRHQGYETVHIPDLFPSFVTPSEEPSACRKRSNWNERSPSTSLPLVSVVMPVFNCALYVREAIESILHQTYANIELILADNGSTDGTWAIVQDYVRRMPQGRISAFQSTESLALNLNRAISTAQGMFIARMDGDDVSFPHRIERQVEFLMAHPTVDIIGCATNVTYEKREVDEEGDVDDDFAKPRKDPTTQRPSRVVIYPTSWVLCRWFLLFQCPVPHPGVVFRKSAILASEGYVDRFPFAEDLDLWIRLVLEHDQRMCNVGEVLVRYRQHGSNSTCTHFAEQKKSTLLLSQTAMETFLQANVSDKSVAVLQSASHAQSLKDIQDAYVLLDRLEQTFACTIKPHEKETIRKDVNARKGRLAYYAMEHFPNQNGVQLWQKWIVSNLSHAGSLPLQPMFST